MPKKHAINKIFVYGTLKEGGYFSNVLSNLRKNSEEAKLLNYDLFDLGQFPGIKEGTGVVIGELHTFNHKDMPVVISITDEIEGYDRSNIKNSLFLRVTKKINNSLAYVYVFNKSVRDEKIIKDGIWKI